MSVFPSLFCILILAGALLSALPVEGSPSDKTSPSCPQEIPSNWLTPADYPRLICTKAELAQAKKTVTDTPWGKSFLEEQRSICAPFLAMDEATLRSLVPKPGSLFVYGLGMNLDPVRGEKMIWCGWSNPFSVKDTKGRIYPNEEWKDDGSGVPDPKTGERRYFIAQGNAAIMQQLEQKVLPALADLYALDGNQVAARNASILLDAISAVYASNKRGPIDYPLDYPGDEVRGGRLDRPYYQTARGLVNYANTVDLIASSGEFEKTSPLGHTIRENVIRDLLWNGGCYCREYAVDNFILHNGQADYLRGSAVTGILLGQKAFCEPLLTGQTGIHALLYNNIGRDGLYYENSPLYAEHSRELYITMAEMVDASRNLGWKDTPSAFADPAMSLFLTDTFDRQEVGGHIPVLGDDGPDLFVNDPMRRLPAKDFALSDNYINGQIQGAWVQLIMSPNAEDRRKAAILLADTYAGKKPIVPPITRWSIYHIGMDAVASVEKEVPNPSRFETSSAFMGEKGLAILRGGHGSKRYGSQLFFGSLHTHGQLEALSWSFYAKGAEWSFDPGYFTSHFRFGWTQHSVAHQSVVVDGRSINPDHGTGNLKSWFSSPEIQWAMADHPGAYQDHGVTEFERLIGQVENPETGDLGYWLDVSFVKGGKFRDDSFHSQMKKADFSIKLPEPAAGSAYCSTDYGRIIQNDCRLKGYDDKGFYWEPEGDGYGFLGNPQRTAMPRNLRVILTDPAYAKQLKTAIVVDMPGSAGQELIVADAPESYNSAPVPYVLRRDTGTGLSVFAKIIRLVDDPSSDHILSFEEVPMVEGSEGKAWCVTWKSGRRDLWLACAKWGGLIRACPLGLPSVSMLGKVGCIVFDKAGHVSSVRASSARSIRIGDKEYYAGPQGCGATGRIRKVTQKGTHVVLKVIWESRERAVTGPLMIISPAEAQPSTWEVSKITGNSIELADVKAEMGSTRLEPVPGKPEWYRPQTAVSVFISASGHSNSGYALGRLVCDRRGPLGRISEISDDGRLIRISAYFNIAPTKPFDARVMEIGEGDCFDIPDRVYWTAK